MIYKNSSLRITAFLPSVIGTIIIDSIIILSHCPTQLFIQPLSSSQRQSEFTYLQENAFEKTEFDCSDRTNSVHDMVQGAYDIR
jgi:hypothetical protein